jgi:hypothetical protein
MRNIILLLFLVFILSGCSDQNTTSSIKNTSISNTIKTGNINLYKDEYKE